MEIRIDSSSLFGDLEVFNKGDREELVNQAKNKIQQFGALFHQRYVSIWPIIFYSTLVSEPFYACFHSCMMPWSLKYIILYAC